MTTIGTSIARLDERKLLTGSGRFTADVWPANAAHAVFVRSPHAHARIVSIDIDAARRAPGVRAVLTAADAKADGLGELICPTSLPGHALVDPHRSILADNNVRFTGEAVACIVADTLAQAADAAELIVVDYQPLASVTDTGRAVGGAQIWPQAQDNISFEWSTGDLAATEQAFAEAARVVSLDIVNNRVAVAPIEMRCAWGRYDASEDRYLLHTPSQGVFFIRDCLAEQVFHVAPERIDVVTGDVGGAFGMKIVPYPEHACVLWAAKVTGRPVVWISERGESFLTDTHARDHVTRASLALDTKGRILALKHDVIANLGAYLSAVSPTVPTLGYAKMAPSVYAVPVMHVRVRGVFTNTAPTDAYRGAGKPEALFVLERLIDTAARDMGIDPAQLRRRNLIGAKMLPYKTAAGQTYDAGDFAAALNEALKLGDKLGFEKRRKRSAKAGRLRGLGCSFYIHGTGGDPDETSKVVAESSGVLAAYTSRQDSGQGHRTVYAQILADRFGIPIDRIDVRQGDSRTVLPGGGTGGSSSLIIGGVAMIAAGAAMIEKARELAARELEVAAPDLEYRDGAFVVKGTDVRLDLFELAARAPQPLEGLAKFAENNASYPYGCQIAEVEIDPETGAVEIVSYLSVDDLGQLIHPAMATAQLVGGIVQGLGQALYEHVRYDPDSGQLTTASFMDYTLPHADDVPSINVAFIGTATKNNSLGVKGAGECGTMGAAPTVINAVVDALAAHGVRHLDMPATPEKIWQALQKPPPAFDADKA
ncbi:xanthine dehydrogenase family protein molybdopterin-binding subunit [Bradyrhizobium sp. LHD-71]|uniref:xanthine dehydrogenase family protein molybdopterin-binding subunit n=1 Tax=Bradyrhizobium sp. LHD-71 TaxID=3072141 RepID=UPI00280C8482|nr:xanthine dehydrogenase family protein molybdopterin-binding subunit [Bradyrhizobium sp. LHD-71]MDQ8727157.1 xanthine dehydrogenase family protein molybdopterin-binding subunit [Bradyrhizobium sp. LHD-71]